MSTDTYMLGRTERETRRLILQHQIYAPLTRRFFEMAGIGRGMKVLDLGSGAGDVSLLAADLVGPEGRVVGVDQNATILETARARAGAAGKSQVSFLAGDVREVVTESDFDAVIGRWILMYIPSPATLLREVASRLRTGGIVAFHENDFSYPPTSFPENDVDRLLKQWVHPRPRPGGGVEPYTGTKLYRAYLEAGLPGPQLVVEAPAGGGPDYIGYEYIAETVRSLLPMLEQTTGLDPKIIDVDTLADRMRDEVVGSKGVLMLPLMFGAWSRTT